MDDKIKKYDGIIPPDDISIYYSMASETVKAAVSQLIQNGERFFLFTTNPDRSKPLAANLLDEPTYGDAIYNALFDFVQKYGHLSFFKLLMFFLNSNTSPVTAFMLYDMLGQNLFQGAEETEAEDEPEADQWN